MIFRSSAILATVGVLGLAGCQVNPNAFPNDPNARAKGGAVTGALLGGFLGASSDEDSFAKAVVGAGVGAAVGGLIGNSLDQQAAELRSSIGNSNVTVQNTGSALIVTMPQDILFATDSANLRPDLTRDIKAVASNLLSYPNSRIEIVGHTDNTGSAAYNQDLSQRRAVSVANILRESGVPNARTTAFGRGEDAPIASNLSPEGRSQNRRVEIIIRPTI